MHIPLEKVRLAGRHYLQPLEGIANLTPNAALAVRIDAWGLVSLHLLPRTSF